MSQAPMEQRSIWRQLVPRRLPSRELIQVEEAVVLS